MGTSGILIFGRGAEAQRSLSSAFAERGVDKRYLAVVAGWPAEDEGCIELPLASDQTDTPIAITWDGRNASSVLVKPDTYTISLQFTDALGNATQYLYDDPEKSVSCISGGISAPGLAFAHGYEINLERATLLYDFNTLGGQPILNRPLTLLTANGKVANPKPKGGTEWCAAFTAELQTAVEGVESGKEPALLSGGLARDALKLCYLEAKSIATGKAISVK
jgi:hypothetical protein